MIRRLAAVTALFSLASPSVRAEDLAVLNRSMRAACPTLAVASLRPVAALDAVASALTADVPLDEALNQAHYRQEASMAATITGKPAAPEQFERTARLLLERYCQDFIDDAYTDVGVYRAPGRLQLVFARPRRGIAADDIPQLRSHLLALVNAARGEPRFCGTQWFPAAGPLTYSDTLTRAAIVHAVDMAQRDRMDHAGSDGSSPSERLTRVGYAWRLSGENLALGYDDVDAMMRGWLASPGHCANIMDARFEEMGAAFAVGDAGDAQFYWVQNFGSITTPARSRLRRAATGR